eukprot:scaffold17347_cov15-Tisochrysis_lutea.AAC.2
MAASHQVHHRSLLIQVLRAITLAVRGHKNPINWEELNDFNCHRGFLTKTIQYPQWLHEGQ